MWKLSKNSIKNSEGIDERLTAIRDRALQISPIDFGHPEHAGRRTTVEQEELYLEGLSHCDGYRKQSYHQSGKALDFYAYVSGAASWKHEHLAIVAAAFLQAACELGYVLEWGGLWAAPWKPDGTPGGFIDMPHMQLKPLG